MALHPLHSAGQERVFTTKTAEGACVTLNGALNAQAKGLATALQRTAPEDVPYWREVAFKAAHRRSKPASPGESLR